MFAPSATGAVAAAFRYSMRFNEMGVCFVAKNGENLNGEKKTCNLFGFMVELFCLFGGVG